MPLNNSKWISPEPSDIQDNSCYRFQFQFAATADTEYLLNIAGDSEFIIFLNGKYLSRGGMPNNPEEPYIEKIRLARLRPGAQLMEILLYYRGVSNHFYHRGDIGLIAEISGITNTEKPRLVFATGVDSVYYRRDTSFLRHNFTITPQLGFLEIRDYNTPPEQIGPEWKMACAPHSPRTPLGKDVPDLQFTRIEAQLVKKFRYRISGETAAGDLIILDNPALEISCHSIRKKLSLSSDCTCTRERSGDACIFELPQELSGYIYADIQAGCAVVCDIAWGEHLFDGRVRAEIHGRSFACRYILKPGLNTVEQSFVRAGCRYIEMHFRALNSDFEGTILRCGINAGRYPFEDRGSFTSSDRLLNRIWQRCRDGLHLGVHHHYQDTPWREQGQYGGDSAVQIACGYSAFGETAMPRKALRQIGTIRDDGFLWLTYPGGFMRPEKNTIPGFHLIWIISCYEYFCYTNDIDFIRSIFPRIIQLLQTFIARIHPDSGMLINISAEFPALWQFIDWSDIRSEEADLCLNVFFHEALVRAAELAGKIRDERGTLFIPIARKIAAGFEQYWSEKAGCYTITGKSYASAHLNVLALQYLLPQIPELNKSTRPERIAHMLRKPSFRKKMTLYFYYYYFRALLNQSSAHFPFIAAIIRRTWGKMLRCPYSTACWETEKGEADFNGAGSLSHGWSAHPLVFLSRFLGGITLTAPKEISITHWLDRELSQCCGVFPLARGSIAYSWRYHAKQKRYVYDFSFSEDLRDDVNWNISFTVPDAFKRIARIDVNQGGTFNTDSAGKIIRFTSGQTNSVKIYLM